MELNSPGIYMENFLAANCDNWNAHNRNEAKIWNEKRAIGLVSKKDFIDFIATTNQQPERGPVLRKLAGEISLHVSSIHLRVNG